MIDDEQEKAFLNEVDIISKLDHPGIIHFVESIDALSFQIEGAYNSVHVIVQEFGLHGCVKDKLDERGRGLEENVARRIFRQLISSTEYMHRAGYVHRDIKDDNMVLGENYDVKLIDFTFAAPAH